MYWRHFNLTAEPFSLTPDPSFLYLSPVHSEAFAAMTMGLRERRGLITMVGEVGTGKTTLVYSLLSGLGPEIHTAYISNARLSFDGILRAALRDFGVPCESIHVSDLLDAFNRFLLKCAEGGTTAALVIDEAQNLSNETFEDLRLLSNFETYTEKLLQIVLVGQPELDAKLREPSLRQVAERVAVRCVVNPLSRSQALDYLAHRLAAVNGSLDLFTRPAARLLTAHSRGIPRSVNILAHNAMLFAYGEGEQRVARRYVAAAIREKTGRSLVRLWRRPKAKSSPTGGTKAPRSALTLAAAALGGVVLGLIIAGGMRLATQISGTEDGAVSRGTTRSPASSMKVARPDKAQRAKRSVDISDPRESAPALIEEPSPEAGPTVNEPVVEPPATEQPEEPAAVAAIPSETSGVPVSDPAPAEPAIPALPAPDSALREIIEEEAELPVVIPEPTVEQPSAPLHQQAAQPAEEAIASQARETAPEIAAVAAPAANAVEQVEAPPRAAPAASPPARQQPSTPESPGPVASAPAAPTPATTNLPPSNTAAEERVKVVTVPEGSSLSDLMLAVYGQYSSRMIANVQAVNPQVTDPDRILAGDNLRFPESGENRRASGTGVEGR